MWGGPAVGGRVPGLPAHSAGRRKLVTTPQRREVQGGGARWPLLLQHPTQALTLQHHPAGEMLHLPCTTSSAPPPPLHMLLSSPSAPPPPHLPVMRVSLQVNDTHVELRNTLRVTLAGEGLITRHEVTLVWACVFPRHAHRYTRLAIASDWRVFYCWCTNHEYRII